MTSDVKRCEALFVGLHAVLSSVYREKAVSEQPEAVRDDGCSGGAPWVGATFLVSVGGLPHSRPEHAWWALHAIAGCTPPGRRLCRYPVVPCGLLWHEGGSHAPTGGPFCAAIAREPSAPGAGCSDNDEACGLRPAHQHPLATRGLV
jgi:hypothetical protein